MNKLKAIIYIWGIAFIFSSCTHSENADYSTSAEISSQESIVSTEIPTPLYPSYDENTKKGGYIDGDGNWTIPPIYDEVGVSYVENANQNIFPVKIDEHWGYVDRQNQWVIKPQFVYAFYFTEEGIALASNKEVIKRFVKDEYGDEKEIGLEEDITKYIPPNDFEEGFASKYSIYYTYMNLGYIDISGEWIVDPKFKVPISILEVVPFWQFNFNRNLALMYDIGTEKYGFIDKKGVWRVKPQYDLEEAIKKKAALN